MAVTDKQSEIKKIITDLNNNKSRKQQQKQNKGPLGN